jgi:Flp pilus assembly CpaE family ATPase
MTTESRVDRRQLRRRADRFAQHMIEEIASLRAALDIQFMRIAQIQAELDLSRAATNGRPLALPPKSSAGIGS